jgi:cytochrome c-type biogenesis protein CcmH/NrfG
MTLKKPTQTQEAESVAAPATGGATIADRFKLDVPETNVGKPKAGKMAAVTLVVALVALALAGILTFVIYQHWEFLKGA